MLEVLKSTEGVLQLGDRFVIQVELRSHRAAVVLAQKSERLIEYARLLEQTVESKVPERVFKKTTPPTLGRLELYRLDHRLASELAQIECWDEKFLAFWDCVDLRTALLRSYLLERRSHSRSLWR